MQFLVGFIRLKDRKPEESTGTAAHLSYTSSVPVSEKVQRLAESYSALSSAERLEFVSLVVPPDDHEVGSEWNEELLRRTREIDEGEVQLIDGDDFLGRLRAV